MKTQMSKQAVRLRRKAKGHQTAETGRPSKVPQQKIGKNGNTEPDTQRRWSLTKSPLSKRPTIQLDSDSSITSISSHRTLGRTRSQRSSTVTSSASPVKRLSKRSSTIGSRASLTNSKSSLSSEVKNISKRDIKKTKKTLWYRYRDFVTVANEEGGWYLCRLKQHVYNTSKSVKISWLAKIHIINTYFFSHADEIDPACILLNVRVTEKHKSAFLNKDDESETERLLQLSKDVVSGEKSIEDMDSDVEEVLQIDAPPPKKRKKCKEDEQLKIRTKRGKRKGKEHNRIPKKDSNVTRKRKVPPKKPLQVAPYDDMLLETVDQFFQTTQHVPFVSKYAHSRLVFRGVMMRDYKLLKELINDTKQIRLLSTYRSVADLTTALDLAIQMKDKESVSLLLQDFEGGRDGTRERRLNAVPPDKINMAKLDTGSYNFRSLDVPYVRKVMASRGSREGNNALLKDLEDMQEQGEHDKEKARTDFICKMLKSGMDFEKLNVNFKDFFLNAYGIDDCLDEAIAEDIVRNIHLALERGHHKLAGRLLKKIAEEHPRDFRMSHLHYEVLLSDKELSRAPPSQVGFSFKKASRITPIHCAACNPDSRHLEKLLKVDPNYLVADKQQRRPIHYAAGCESKANLELLLKCGASLYDADQAGNIPLHYAVQANRKDNVLFLLESCQEREDSTNETLFEKFGKRCIDRPNKASKTPLHIAAENDFVDIVDVLISNGAKTDCRTSVSNMKLTPLMVAAQKGFFRIVDRLSSIGDAPYMTDRLGRTPLIHAVMNGNQHILARFLNIGVNPEYPDNSGNTALHYAAAYGWYFCVKMLMKVKVNVNVANNWKTTPLSIAYMKGHMGLVHLLLQETDVDVNFRDDDGMTLVSTAAASPLYPELTEQMTFLIERMKACCTYTDIEGKTPGKAAFRISIPSDTAMDTSVKIAKLLVANGCDVEAKDKNGHTAIMTAMVAGNARLVEYLESVDCPILTDVNSEGYNVLHDMASQHMNSMRDYTAILQYLCTGDGKSRGPKMRRKFATMAASCSHTGFSPLLAACLNYAHTWDGSSPPVNWMKLKPDPDEYNYIPEELAKVIGHDPSCRTLDEYIKLCPQKEQQTWDVIWNRGRSFLRFLITDLKSDVDTCSLGPGGDAAPAAVDILASVEIPEYSPLRKDTEPEFPALRMLLEYKPKLDLREPDGHTILTRCLKKGLDAPAKILVEANPKIVDNVAVLEDSGNEYKLTCPMLAALFGKWDTLELILKYGGDPNSRDTRNGHSVLHAVIRRDRELQEERRFVRTRYGRHSVPLQTDNESTLKKIMSLLNYGADVNSLDDSKQSPLHLAVDTSSGKMDANLGVILVLVKQGAHLATRDTSGRTPLHYVFVKMNMREMSMELDPVELCRIVASRMQPADLNIRDNQGRTALHWAAYRGANICCMYLMQRGADVNVKDNAGDTPLRVAVMLKRDGCAALLIQNGAEIKDEEEVTANCDDNSSSVENTDDNDAQKNKDVYFSETKTKSVKRPDHTWRWQLVKKEENLGTRPSLLQMAMENELQGVCFLLMEKHVKETGITFDDAIAVGLQLQKYNIVERLLETTADTSALRSKREHRRNLLHILALTAKSCDSVTRRVVDQLMESGVSLTEKDCYSCTPLLYASLSNNFELGKYFLSKPKVYNPKYTDHFGRTVLAAAFWEPSSMDENLKQWVEELCNRKGFTSTTAALDFPLPDCRFGSQKDIAHPNYWKTYFVPRVSPLIVAIHRENQDFTQWLLKKGADVNAADSAGVTPLMHAVKVNDLDLVKTLMNFNFDPKSSEGQTDDPMEPANKRKFQVMLAASGSSISSDEAGNAEDEEMAENQHTPGPAMSTKELRPFKKVSAVNLNAVDKKGWTVMHHAASCLSYGTFDNEEMVFILAKVGAKMDARNKDGDAPLDLALKTGSVKVARMLQELGKTDAKKMKEPKYQSTPPVDDGMNWADAPPSFREDAEKMLEKLGRPMATEEDYEPSISASCTVTNGRLVEDEELGLLYDVLMTKVDVKVGTWGLYNFYEMQLVYQPGMDLYVLFTRWGRIGDNGQFQHTPFSGKVEAAQEFSKIFRSKTGNKWTDIKSFKPHTGKYQLVDNNRRAKQRGKVTDINFQVTSTVKSNLPDHLQDVLIRLTDVNALKYNSGYFNHDAMPIGRLQKSTLDNALQILSKIGALLEKMRGFEEQGHTTENADGKCVDEKTTEHLQACQEISDLSSEYFQLIPQKEYRYEKLQPLSKIYVLKKHMQLIRNLLDYETTSHLLLGAMYRAQEVNPLDYIYQSVGCKIEMMAELDTDTQYILRYIASSDSRSKIGAIYKLKRRAEQMIERRAKCGNRRLLFHGTGVANILSILTRGLVIATPEARVTGHAFGKGIYFSDIFSESESYCSSSDGETFFMLVCEVALGKEKLLLDPEKDRKTLDGCDSLHIMSSRRPHAKFDVVLPNGCKIPLGNQEWAPKCNQQWIGFRRNMFVVFDEKQVILRYLIQFTR